MAFEKQTEITLVIGRRAHPVTIAGTVLPPQEGTGREAFAM